MQKVAAMGLDVHYKFSTVSMRDEQARVVARERLEHTDRAALRARLAAWPKGVPAVLEASFGWGWLTDELAAAGIDVQLCNCYKLGKMRQARQDCKTNKKDADLVSLLPFEATAWWRSWLAPPEVRDHREWMRYRADLVGVQTQTKSRICAVFHRHGVFHDFSDLFGCKGRAFLAELCREGRHSGGVLPPGALTALRGQVRLLDQVRKQLADVGRQLRKVLQHDALTRRLSSIPGIGLVLANVLKSEIGHIERFGGQQNRLACYSLLGPRANDTGQADPSRSPLGRHLGQRGNRTLKWAFIEAAHGAVRRGGRWRAMFDRVTKGGKTDRNRGYIRVARELVAVVTAIWKNGTKYQDRPPARPGSGGQSGPSAGTSPRQRMETFLSRPGAAPGTENLLSRTRSGTGQPYPPMVPAVQA